MASSRQSSGGLVGAATISLIIGAASSTAKQAFDAIVQRDAPDANRGRSFARFETRFQLLWVIGALIPILIPIPAEIGFVLIAAVALFAVVSYFVGMARIRKGRRLARRHAEAVAGGHGHARRADPSVRLRPIPPPPPPLPAPPGRRRPSLGDGRRRAQLGAAAGIRRRIPLGEEPTEVDAATAPAAATGPGCAGRRAAGAAARQPRSWSSPPPTEVDPEPPWRNAGATVRRRARRRAGLTCQASGRLSGVGQVDAGEPEAGGVDLGRRRQVALVVPEADQRRVARPLDDAVDEAAAAVVLGLGELEAEQALDEPVGRRRPRPVDGAPPR